MAESRCTGNCMACTVFQRQYCSAQLAYSNMRMLELMQQTINELKDDVSKLQETASLQKTSEEGVFSPFVSDSVSGTAQSGDGAVE